MEKPYNSRPNIRGKHDRTELNRVRLRIYHAKNRRDTLALETQTNDELLEQLLQQEQGLAHGEVL